MLIRYCGKCTQETERNGTGFITDKVYQFLHLKEQVEFSAIFWAKLTFL